MFDYVTIYQRRRLRIALNITLVGVVAGLFYPVLGDGFGHWLPFLNGLMIGLLGGAAVAVFELIVFDPKRRGLGFLTLHFTKVTTYFLFFTLLILVVKAFNDSRYLDLGFTEYVVSESFLNFLWPGDFVIIEIYAFVMISLIIFARQIIRKMGQRVFVNYITGKYHHPQKENRIFLYLDLKGSTTIAEKLGDIKFHQLISDFFYDITASILIFKGEVYRYVGDEVVITWLEKDGLDNANCLRVHFDAKRRIWQNRENYLTKYNLVPDFRSAANAGEVFAGEIGDVKSQIVYQGQVLFVTRAMEKFGKDKDDDLIITRQLLDKLELPQVIKVRPAGELKPSPDSEAIEILGLNER